MKEVIEQANEFVREHEAYIMSVLIRDVFEKQKKHFSCGCPNCTKEYKSAVRAMDHEWMRQLPPERAQIYEIVTRGDQD